MSKSTNPASIPAAQQVGACDSFAEWRRNKGFVVGGALASSEELKANALKLRRQILGDSQQ